MDRKIIFSRDKKLCDLKSISAFGNGCMPAEKKLYSLPYKLFRIISATGLLQKFAKQTIHI